MPYGYIYIIENLINGKMYVGQTTDFDGRLRSHKNGRSGCPALKGAVNKYGSENFDFSIIEACGSLEELNERETYWIVALATVRPGGYNIEGGGGVSQLSEHSKRKIGEANSQYVRTPEYREKIREMVTGEGNPFYGKKHSEASKEKMRQFRLSYEIPEETRRKMSNSHKGMPSSTKGKSIHSLEMREKWSKERAGEKNGMFGKKHSEETRLKMRQGWARRKLGAAGVK